MMDLIVSWLCTAIAGAFQAFAKFFTNIFGFSPLEFARTFSYAGDIYSTIRSIALALALVLAGWQILTFFFKGSEASVSPIRAALNAVIAVAFIFYGNYLLEIVLELCQYPFNALQEINGVEVGGHFIDKETGLEAVGTLLVAKMSTAFAGTSMLLYLILLILILFSFVKLLLEIVERYVVTFVLVYLSPLASATLASSATSGIYKKFITMFFSQCLLLLLNVWCLRMACSGMSLSGYEGSALVIPLLLCYAFLRVSAKMDSYINQLGLNAAITGNGLGAEIMATGMSLMGMGKGGHGGSSAGEGIGNKVLGASKAVQTYANRYTDLGALKTLGADAIKGAAKGGSEAYRSGESIWSGVKDGAARGIKTSDNAFSNLANSTDAQNKVIDGINDGINKITGRNVPDISHRTTASARDTLNEQLVYGVSIDKPKHYDSLTEMQRSQIDEEIAHQEERTHAQNISDWSSNEHLAQSGFNYVQKTGKSVEANGIGDESARIAAIAKGIGVGNQSKEAAEFIKVGMGQGDGTSNEKFVLDKTGIHGTYDKDGYRHKMDVCNQSQFDKLSTQQKEGMRQWRNADGDRYYINESKTKIDATGTPPKPASSQQEDLT